MLATFLVVAGWINRLFDENLLHLSWLNCVQSNIAWKIKELVKMNETDAELRQRLSKTAYEVTQHAATEAPYTGEYDQFDEPGIYVDVVSGEPLFSSLDKYDAGCGWPSFTKPIQPAAVTEQLDQSHGMLRQEVRSNQANSHLGHVFSDGPKTAGGQRYCMNSAAMRFVPVAELQSAGYGQYLELFDGSETER